MNEAAVQANIRLQAAKDGVMLWRNNTGALLDENGRMVRFGLGNDSVAVNRNYKSSDLVGIRPVLIDRQHIGTYMGQFIGIEVKQPGWRMGEREQAQEAWLGLVRQWGGVGGFAASVAEAQKLWG